MRFRLGRHLSVRRRPYSIKTRIKTCRKCCNATLVAVADHIPLKQGLRHRIFIPLTPSTWVADHIPLKQGLRHPSCD